MRPGLDAGTETGPAQLALSSVNVFLMGIRLAFELQRRVPDAKAGLQILLHTGQKIVAVADVAAADHQVRRQRVDSTALQAVLRDHHLAPRPIRRRSPRAGKAQDIEVKHRPAAAR